MDRYNRQEQDYNRDEPDRLDPSPSGAPGKFPWDETTGTDQPARTWEEQHSASEQHAVGTASGPGSHEGTQAAAGSSAVVNITASGQPAGNGMAVAGFVLSLVMWIPIPFLNLVLWILAVTFSSIGLRRANKQGLPHRGLAIAGLCISTVGVLFAIVVILAFVGAIASLG
ncbi:MAG: DUF4190 domain-containing protein [Acidimicrobiia bacterium]|nr:DUF4190 domain-containing protein [Acidimicrobiia bacterium]